MQTQARTSKTASLPTTLLSRLRFFVDSTWSSIEADSRTMRKIILARG
jgi:hypothetical protein